MAAVPEVPVAVVGPEAPAAVGEASAEVPAAVIWEVTDSPLRPRWAADITGPTVAAAAAAAGP